VRRALPTARRRLVGPFIFFDRMGPAILRAGEALDVRPHPHIGLSTVTYLFDGRIRHRDSLGTEMVIEPGDVNLMTAGRGIVHSERSPEEMRGSPLSISGLQTWLALPDGKEEIAPRFDNTSRTALPEFPPTESRARWSSAISTACVRLWRRIRRRSTSTSAWNPAQSIQIPAATEERAIYVLAGDLVIAGDRFPSDRLLVLRPGDEIVVGSERGATSCCSAAPRSARSDTSGGTSSPLRASASSRPRRSGGPVASTSCRATRRSLFRCRKTET
jgi:redox-sensitive bicupin YhaK (pirin superfamily)